MSRGTLPRGRRPLPAVVALLLALTPMQASAAGPVSSGPRDITNTAGGRSFALEASRRIADRYGIDPPADSLSVWSMGGRRMAGPRGTSLAVKERRVADGTVSHAYEATAGKFRNKWTEGLCMMRQGETSLEFEIASRVAQNKVPTWTFAWYEEADLAACFF